MTRAVTAFSRGREKGLMTTQASSSVVPHELVHAPQIHTSTADGPRSTTEASATTGRAVTTWFACPRCDDTNWMVSMSGCRS